MREKKFTNKQLFYLIIPIIIEQVLGVTIGLFDSIMVSYAGETAISAVALVNDINALIVGFITSIITGGSLLFVHKVGSKDYVGSKKIANQTFFVVFLMTITISIIILVINDNFLKIFYQDLEGEIFNNAVLYLMIIAFTYPFIGMFTVDAAIFRAKGKTAITMYISVLINILNLIGNAIFIMVFKWGVFGAALSTLIVRIIAFLIMSIQMEREPFGVRKLKKSSYKLDKLICVDIFKTGMPLSVDLFLFQIGKILVQNLIISFGVATISASAVFGQISTIVNIPGGAISVGMVTVVGQSLGAKRIKEATQYAKKLLSFTYALMLIMNVLMYFFVPTIISIFNISVQAKEICLWMVRLNCFCSTLLWPASFQLPNVFKAGLDTKFVMYISIISMWTMRVGMSYVLVHVFSFGFEGIWYAIYLDWALRSSFFCYRFFSKKWLRKTLDKHAIA